jgi:hypothetical protein
MANQKVTELRSLNTSSIADPDLFIVVDVDALSSPTGETKNINFHDLAVKVNTWSGSLESVSDVFHITNAITGSKQVTLTYQIHDADDVVVDIRHAPSQTLGIDYTVTHSLLSWNGLDLDGQINTGDVMTVRYQRMI